MIEIREETEEDYQAIRKVNDRAFGQPDEGRIVDKIRDACKEAMSLVAVLDHEIVGHVFFSPVAIHSSAHSVTGMGLGPMSVLPDFQNRGIGTMLVNEGLRRIRGTSCPFVVVLGHETYYPRFGFERASQFGLTPQWEGIPDAAFMAIILDEKAMKDVEGVVTYREEFSAAM